jgi:hypothetical protein
MGRKAIEILQDVADQLGWTQPTTLENPDQLEKQQRKLVRAFKRVLRAMSAVNDWHFLRKQGEIELVASYTTGTMRLTNSATTCTGQVDDDGNSPVWTPSMEGRAIVISGHQVVYRVQRVNSATSITLDRDFIGTTSDGGTTQDDYSYKIVQDRYDLPVDFDRPVDEDWTLYTSTSKLDLRLLNPNDIRDRRASRDAYSTGTPTAVTLWRRDDEGEHRVAVFDPYPDTQQLVRFDYQALHPDIEFDYQRVLFEQKYEEMILNGIEFLIMRGPEDDQRAGLMLQEYLQERNSSVARREIGQQRTRLTPSAARAFREKNKWAGRGARIDWGSFFDLARYHDL